MKTKSVSILFGIFFIISALAFLLNIYIISVFAFMGCNLSARPTKSKVSEIVSKYGVILPETIELINYATDIGFDGGIWYCIFAYDYGDDQFNSLLSDEKDDEFEDKFSACIKSVKLYFKNDYAYPDLKRENYKWLYDYATSSSGNRGYELFILYFENENQLVVIDNTIQIRNQNRIDIK